MDRSSFRALSAFFVGLPLVGVVALASHPASRAWILALASPPPVVPTRSPDAGALVLPSLSAPLGAESVELRTLREDSVADRGLLTAPAPAQLFAPLEGGEIPTPAGTYTRPAGLRQIDLGARNDAAVDRALHQLSGSEATRGRLRAALQRYARARLDVTRVVQAWKLPEAVLGVAFVASAFTSSQGRAEADAGAGADVAAGAWALRADVAHVYGLSMLPAYDERRGIASGTEAAAHHLADLRERLGSWELAFVAFGFGYRATLDEIAARGSSDYWELSTSLPPEVLAYVAEVHAVALVLANLDRFGLEGVLREGAIAASALDVPPGMSLDLVARAAGITTAELRDLNPEYTSALVPATNFQMVVHVPSETLVRAREMLPRVAAGEIVEDRTDASAPAAAAESNANAIAPVAGERAFYRVKEGDTLAALASQHQVPIETLASDNALDPTGELKPGMLIAIRSTAPPEPSPSPTPPPRKPRTKKTKQHGR